MKLLTKEIEKRFPPLYANEDKKPDEVKIIVKFFNPCGAGNWYATEYDPEQRLFFGYACLGDPSMAELGYFSLDELESVKGPLGIGIERDLHFGFEHTLAEVMKNPFM